MPFALSSEGELIRIYDEQDKLNFSVYYQTASPWPLEVNTNGYTLEWTADADNVNSSEAWFAGCVLGSPGTVFIPCDTTIVQEEGTTRNPSIYPNPAKSFLYVQLAQNASGSLRILDTQGLLVLEQQLPATNLVRIETETWPAGIYLVQITQANQQWNQRVVITAE
jgi:hypothetical protein